MRISSSIVQAPPVSKFPEHQSRRKACTKSPEAEVYPTGHWPFLNFNMAKDPQVGRSEETHHSHYQTMRHRTYRVLSESATAGDVGEDGSAVGYCSLNKSLFVAKEEPDQLENTHVKNDTNDARVSKPEANDESVDTSTGYVSVKNEKSASDAFFAEPSKSEQHPFDTPSRSNVPGLLPKPALPTSTTGTTRSQDDRILNIASLVYAPSWRFLERTLLSSLSTFPLHRPLPHKTRDHTTVTEGSTKVIGRFPWFDGESSQDHLGASSDGSYDASGIGSLTVEDRRALMYQLADEFHCQLVPQLPQLFAPSPELPGVYPQTNIYPPPPLTPHTSHPWLPVTSAELDTHASATSLYPHVPAGFPLSHYSPDPLIGYEAIENMMNHIMYTNHNHAYPTAPTSAITQPTMTILPAQDASIWQVPSQPSTKVTKSLPTSSNRAKHRCDTCGKTFSRDGSLKDHMHVHTGEKRE
ncbi:hypothetical protein RhiJN_06600 [Ceratobasidium sp. AG-Ba]|nr:hypothetical protein RhiJN_06600 [Ceratobasidium sp. AG-Ba]